MRVIQGLAIKPPLNSLWLPQSQLHTSCSVRGRALSRCYRIRVIGCYCMCECVFIVFVK